MTSSTFSLLLTNVSATILCWYAVLLENIGKTFLRADWKIPSTSFSMPSAWFPE
eukprot:CAMPEP_0118639976 /NCGR_PEP_ID=MMETSP0785-20121206/4510_1 /TAXON_ID=91992 /ORGANISM="Bolidomonas pacifica, Strain CCMP 1866" /LENGTH=53 /DNA_ID=CAMNT_0006531339 /DNA_START=139 /DNA_END=300 /DNA_ORIENTATION=+